MQSRTGKTPVQLPEPLVQRVKRVARFVGDGTVQNYIASHLERIVTEDETALRPVLEELERRQQAI